jgi:hypothetical protein
LIQTTFSTGPWDHDSDPWGHDSGLGPDHKDLLSSAAVPQRAVQTRWIPYLTCARRTLPHHRAWQYGFTGLCVASQNGHLEMVRLLLNSKADANLADKVLPPPSHSGARVLPTHVPTARSAA